MAHGLGATRTMRLAAFARRFVEAGYAALVFDYRHFGDSGGEPRQLLDIGRQLDDWQAAVRFARTLDDIDPTKVILWGSSFGGGPSWPTRSLQQTSRRCERGGATS